MASAKFSGGEQRGKRGGRAGEGLESSKGRSGGEETWLEYGKTEWNDAL